MDCALWNEYKEICVANPPVLSINKYCMVRKALLGNCDLSSRLSVSVINCLLILLFINQWEEDSRQCERLLIKGKQNY